ncbi:MAG: hypothetical protein ACK40G_01485 [Cytophagaceae bacterium]
MESLKICIIAVIVFIFSLQSCTTPDKKPINFIDVPFESLTDEALNFTVEPSSETVIRIPGGTRIIIPREIFINQNGEAVKTPVTIKYKEYHDAAGIIFSGIPMNYDTAGKQGHFQTAGMFDIRGYSEGQPVFISQGKHIEVQMASNAGEANYNFYKLDTNSRNWVYDGTASPVENPEKEQQINQMIGQAVTPPIEPAPLNPDNFVFDVKINTKNYPELKDFHDIIWQYAGTEDSTDPEKNAWIFEEKWTDFSLTIKNAEQNLFWLDLKNRKNSFRTVVKAVFSDNKIVKAKKNFEKRKEEYNAYLAKKQEAARRLRNEMDFVRSYKISEFGICNWDRLFPDREFKVIAADFKVDENIIDKNLMSVFLVTGDNRVAIRYRKDDWKTFGYAPSHKNIILAIYPDNHVAFCRDISERKFNILSPPASYTFEFEKEKKKINSEKDLRELIEKLIAEG